jgi:hypothetical protein
MMVVLFLCRGYNQLRQLVGVKRSMLMVVVLENRQIANNSLGYLVFNSILLLFLQAGTNSMLKRVNRSSLSRTPI